MNSLALIPFPLGLLASSALKLSENIKSYSKFRKYPLTNNIKNRKFDFFGLFSQIMVAQFYLDPLNQAFANTLATKPGMENLSIPELRDSLVQLNAHEELPGVKRTKIQVPVANGTETWIYTPVRTQGPRPYIFYVHGGGFVGGK